MDLLLLCKTVRQHVLPIVQAQPTNFLLQCLSHSSQVPIVSAASFKEANQNTSKSPPDISIEIFGADKIFEPGQWNFQMLNAFLRRPFPNCSFIWYQITRHCAKNGKHSNKINTCPFPVGTIIHKDTEGPGHGILLIIIFTGCLNSILVKSK